MSGMLSLIIYGPAFLSSESPRGGRWHTFRDFASVQNIIIGYRKVRLKVLFIIKYLNVNVSQLCSIRTMWSIMLLILQRVLFLAFRVSSQTDREETRHIIRKSKSVTETWWNNMCLDRFHLHFLLLYMANECRRYICIWKMGILFRKT